ncbi:hypothetical protein N658DRAFT_61460 [Parathielavia hyrcaniae]|uniref:Uncharacterized protein n=1 Tax=Parathielavia hyrcaniae TaxID=113614 RepID=A0AAN6T2A8_9PEZI|nr:hypothetical protein N658DRAFT_61460 [Parathielavia hyrcaniae]
MARSGPPIGCACTSRYRYICVLVRSRRGGSCFLVEVDDGLCVPYLPNGAHETGRLSSVSYSSQVCAGGRLLDEHLNGHSCLPPNFSICRSGLRGSFP